MEERTDLLEAYDAAWEAWMAKHSGDYEGAELAGERAVRRAAEKG